MALEVNGASILAAISTSPAAFGMSESQVSAIAMSTLLSRLKDKTFSLENIRSVAHLIGASDFRLALDHLAAKDAGALVKRLDPKNPELKGADETWQRSRLAALAEGAAPAEASVRPSVTKIGTAPRGKGSKTGEVMKSKALRPRASKKTIGKDE